MKNRILLVEDDPRDEMLIRRALEASGLANEIIIAHDGEEALQLIDDAAANQKLPTLVLLDLRMPRLDGLDVLRHIREDPLTKTLPVVVMTSSDEESDIVSSYRIGANSYVRKPVRFDEFTQAVQQVGLYWLVTNEAPPAG